MTTQMQVDLQIAKAVKKRLAVKKNWAKFSRYRKQSCILGQIDQAMFGKSIIDFPHAEGLIAARQVHQFLGRNRLSSAELIDVNDVQGYVAIKDYWGKFVRRLERKAKAKVKPTKGRHAVSV